MAVVVIVPGIVATCDTCLGTGEDPHDPNEMCPACQGWAQYVKTHTTKIVDPA